jgi:hypothetical protein
MRFIALQRAWLALAVVAGLAGPAAADQATVYGKKLLHSYELPREALAKFAGFNAKNRSTTGLLPDTVDWSGDAFEAPTSGNPYTLVIKVVGTAQGDGEVSTRWQPGWNIDGGVRGAPMPHVRKDGVKAGQRVELVSAMGPISFKTDRQVAPVAGFAGSSNLKLDTVQVEVWSGVGKATFPQLVTAWAPLLTGLICLGLVLWWRRR